MRRAADKVNTETDLDELKARLTAYMDQKGLRSTAQRRLVTETFFEAPGHLSIEELLEVVRKQDPKVGYATVYRTLKLLTDSGLAQERHFGDGVSRYEVAHLDEHHDHLICVRCGRIEEFENDEVEAMQDRIAAAHGFVLERHRHELYGVCHSCHRDRG